MHVVIAEIAARRLWLEQKNENLHCWAQTHFNSTCPFSPLSTQVKFTSSVRSTFFFCLSFSLFFFFSEGGLCYWKLMNTLQPIRTAHPPKASHYDVKNAVQSVHMHTAITVMKMEIIVQSGMEVVCRLLPDPILSSLRHRREREWDWGRRTGELDSGKYKKKKIIETRSGEVQAWVGDRAIDAIVKCAQSPTEEWPKTRWSVDTWHATLTPHLSAASESLSHWDLTASDAKKKNKNPSSNAI